MISGVVTKDFGLLASDSSIFDTRQGVTSFQSLRLFYVPDNYVLAYQGSPSYFAKIDKSKFYMDVPTLSLYLEDYLKKIKPDIEKAEMKSEETSDFCLLVLGLHKKLPTIVQFNNCVNFKPKYLFSDSGFKFSTVIYDDEKKKKQYSEMVEYMDKKSHKFEKKGIDFSPGIAAEVLIRGIYKAVDTEEKKISGGCVNVGGVLSTGILITLSGLTPA